MVTYEMVGVADQNTRVYESEYGTYSKADGFILSPLATKMDKVELLDKMFHEDCWHIQKPLPKRMSKKQIEKALGYEVEIVDDTEKKENNTQKEEITIDEFMKLLFGLED